jgi:hypothetical protein
MLRNPHVRGALAVIGGYLTMVLGVTTFFTFVTVVLLGRKMGEPPKPSEAPAWLYVVELVATPILAGLGGYVCAWIAQRKQMRHALVLVGVMLVMGVISIFTEAGLKPLWSSIAIVVLGAAGVPLGARMRIAHEGAVA